MTTFEDGYHAGQLRERVSEHDRRLNAINGSIEAAQRSDVELTATVAELARKVEGIGVRVGMYAAMAAFVASIAGSIVTGVVVYAIVQR